MAVDEAMVQVVYSISVISLSHTCVLLFPPPPFLLLQALTENLSAQVSVMEVKAADTAKNVRM